MNQKRLEKPFYAQYRRVESDLRQRIRSGRWNAGAMLPSRRDLASEYQVSSVTIGRAVETLIAEGLLHADSRRGTFVAQTAGPAPPGDADLAAGDTDSAPGGSLPRPLVVGIVAAFGDAQNDQDAVILRALEHALSDGGHVTSVCNRAAAAPGTLAPLAESIASLLQDGPDALVIICLDLDRVRFEEALGRVDLHDTPTVCILAGELHLPIPHVFYDNRIGGYQAARHLIEKGHRQIAVFAPFSASWVTERIAGIRHALAHSRLPAPEIQIFTGDGRTWDYQDDPVALGGQATRTALESGWVAEGGIICISDQVAHGVCHVARGYGYAPGKDFAVVGFDDEKCARSGGLTTLRPPLEAMGREAARLLIAEVEGPRVNLQLRLRAHLITRSSTNFPPERLARSAAAAQEMVTG